MSTMMKMMRARKEVLTARFTLVKRKLLLEVILLIKKESEKYLEIMEPLIMRDQMTREFARISKTIRPGNLDRQMELVTGTLPIT